MEEKRQNKGLQRRLDREKCKYRIEKKSKMVCKLTELINNPLSEQMLPKNSPKDLSKNLIIGLNLNQTHTRTQKKHF